jgi:hypothetical protein
MPARPRKNPISANPFYLILLVASTLFVVTCLAYFIVPTVLSEAPAPERAPSLALAEWLDHRAPLLLGIEFAVMLVFGVLAMLTDDWFARRSAAGSTGNDTTAGPGASE